MPASQALLPHHERLRGTGTHVVVRFLMMQVPSLCARSAVSGEPSQAARLCTQTGSTLSRARGSCTAGEDAGEGRRVARWALRGIGRTHACAGARRAPLIGPISPCRSRQAMPDRLGYACRARRRACSGAAGARPMARVTCGSVGAPDGQWPRERRASADARLKLRSPVTSRTTQEGRRRVGCRTSRS